MISVITPSRGRPDKLFSSYKSLSQMYDSSVTGIEFCIRLDEDDPQLEDNLHIAGAIQAKYVVGKRHGYENLHLYVNELCEMAAGDWLFLWNDDAKMKTYRWWDKVHEHNGEMVVLNPATTWALPGSCLFPIVPKSVFDIWGHFSLNRHNDTWIEQIAQRLGILVDVDIEIVHEAAGHSNYDPNFWSDANKELMTKDVEVLKPYVKD